MKYLKLIALLFAATAFAQVKQTALVTLAGLTPNNPLDGQIVIHSIVAAATTANLTKIWIYDSSTTDTNRGYPATLAPLSYATNWESLTTNVETGFVYTNTFAGVYNTTTVVAAATNELAKKVILFVPSGGVSERVINKQFTHGLNLMADTNAVVEIVYTLNP